MVRGNIRGYSKEKESGRQCEQRLLKKYNSPTYLRLKRKVAAKNAEDLIKEYVETSNDLTEINQKSYPFLPIYHKERKLIDYHKKYEDAAAKTLSVR